MIVRMRIKVSGTRNGEDWPEIGGTIDLPGSEAQNLITHGWASEVPLDTIRLATVSGGFGNETTMVPRRRRRAEQRS
jgi:hypothetical protein